MSPGRIVGSRNRAPEGERMVPSADSVLKQMFFEMMSDGYIDLKSRTTTQWASWAWMACTYPPSMGASRPARWVGGTPMCAWSAAGINNASTRVLVRPFIPSSR